MRESKSVFARSPSRNKRPLPPGGYRDPTLAQWVKHSAAKEDEDKKKTIFVPSPRASARTRLVLSWYAAGAVPWQEVSWTDSIPHLKASGGPPFPRRPFTKLETLLTLVHERKYEELDALLLRLRQQPPIEVVSLAFERAYPPLFLLCLKHGANPARELKGGLTYLHVAAHRGDASLVRVLLRYVGDVDARDDRGLTALHFACQPAIPCYYKTGIIQDLLEYGADVNATDKHGQAPLHIAIRAASAGASATSTLATVALLLKSGADACLEDAQGLLPLDHYRCSARAGEQGDATFQALLQLFASCLPDNKLRRMHAKRLSRRLVKAVMESFQGRCGICRRYLHRCKALKKTHLVWWLWSHDCIPH